MNFLGLCQRTAQECGVATGSAIAAALPSVAGASGSLARVVNWVGDAWRDIQMAREDWIWMRSSSLLGAGLSFQTVAGKVSYPLGSGPGTVGIPVDSFGKWDREAFRSFGTGVGQNDEMFLDEIDYDDWRDGYMVGAMRTTNTRPIVVAIGPDQSVNLGPPPIVGYTVTGDYFVAPSELVADLDVPLGLPTRFHMMIVYAAMVKYAGYESAPEVADRGTREYGRMYSQLLSLRAQRLSFGGALAAILLLLGALAAPPAAAQSAGTMALQGPSTSHGAAQITPQALNAAINAALAAKADALNGVLTNAMASGLLLSADPILPAGAATKHYVDQLFATIVAGGGTVTTPPVSGSQATGTLDFSNPSNTIFQEVFLW